VAITTIIFDLGNVVIGWDPYRVYRPLLESDEAIGAFFDEVGFAEWNVEQDRGRPWSEAVAELSSRFPHRRELIHAFYDRWDDSITGIIEGTVDIIRRLRDRGLQLIGLTNWSGETFARTRPRYDVFALFDDIVVSGAVGLIKPDPAIFDLTLKRAGRRPSECLFIDDSKVNVAAAAELGLDAILFESPPQLERALRSREIL
jgi:epoxide hydrolase-like predicted phosphatase